MGFIQFYFGLPFAVIIICIFFIPVYTKLKVFTAYQFLENRFDRKTRILTASLFLIQRGLAAGITIYAPAIILSVVLNWNLKFLIILIGFSVILYTAIGGTRALNSTHKIQMFIMISGMFIALFYIIGSLPENINTEKALKIAGLNGKLNLLDFSFDINNRYTFWSGITGGFFLALSYFGTDQSQVQRYLSGKSLRESQMGLLMNAILKIPMQFLILLVGVFVFIFYQFQIAPIHFNPKAISEIKSSNKSSIFNKIEYDNYKTQNEKIKILRHNDFLESKEMQSEFLKLEKEEKNQRERVKNIIDQNLTDVESNDKDYVFISFILNYLPIGLVGLLLAVILSAAMSSTSSELNALTSTTVIDLYKPTYPNKSESHYLKMSKIFTFMWGIIAIIFANISSLFENLIQLINIIGSIFYGTILGVFLVAIFIKKIKSNSIFYAAIISEVIIIILFISDLFGYLWLNLFGAIFTIILSLFFSLFNSKNQ
jgi:Na+/proline symporter